MDSGDTQLQATKVEKIGADGQAEQRFQLTSGSYKVLLSSLGATIVELWMPDKDGAVADCVLGFDKVEEYDRHRDLNPYFGCVVGRVANRIRDAKFTIDGKDYQLEPNLDAHLLHSGKQDLHRKNWSCELVDNGVKFTVVSEDGHEGWPASVKICATYTLTAYSATSVDLSLVMTAELLDKSENKSSPIGLTNHAYFNLDGHNCPDGVLKNCLQINADAYTEMDADSVTTGNLIKLDDVPSMDFRKQKELSQALEELKEANKIPQDQFDKIIKEKASFPFGVDHNYCFGGPTQEPREIAKIVGSTGRSLTLLSTSAGVQCYTANYVNNIVGKSSAPYSQWQAVCLETQSYPNSISVDGDKYPEFKKGETFILRPDGPNYTHTAVYRLGL